MDAALTIALASAALGGVLALLRLLPRALPRAPAWQEALVLFFLASAVCDAVAWLNLGGTLHLNAYWLAACYLLIGIWLPGRQTAQPQASSR